MGFPKLAEIESLPEFQEYSVEDKAKVYDRYYEDVTNAYPDRAGFIEQQYSRSMDQLTMLRLATREVDDGRAPNVETAFDQILKARETPEGIKAYVETAKQDEIAGKLLNKAYPQDFSTVITAKPDDDRPDAPRVEIQRLPYPGRARANLRFFKEGKKDPEVVVPIDFGEQFDMEKLADAVEKNAEKVGTRFPMITGGSTITEKLLQAPGKMLSGIEEGLANPLSSNTMDQLLDAPSRRRLRGQGVDLKAPYNVDPTPPRSFEEYRAEGSRFEKMLPPGNSLRQAVELVRKLSDVDIPFSSPEQDLLERVGRTSLSRQLHTVFGEAPVQIGTYIAGGAPLALIANWGLIYQGEAQQALAETGGDLGLAHRVASRSALLQAPLETLTDRVALKGLSDLGYKIFGRSKFGEVIKRTVDSGFTEGLTEPAQQGIANQVAQAYYDENRGDFEGMPESAVVGMLAGLLLGGATASLQGILGQFPEGEIPGNTPGERLKQVTRAIQERAEETERLSQPPPAQPDAALFGSDDLAIQSDEELDADLDDELTEILEADEQVNEPPSQAAQDTDGIDQLEEEPVSVDPQTIRPGQTEIIPPPEPPMEDLLARPGGALGARIIEASQDPAIAEEFQGLDDKARMIDPFARGLEEAVESGNLSALTPEFYQQATAALNVLGIQPEPYEDPQSQAGSYYDAFQDAIFDIQDAYANVADAVAPSQVVDNVVNLAPTEAEDLSQEPAPAPDKFSYEQVSQQDEVSDEDLDKLSWDVLIKLFDREAEKLSLQEQKESPYLQRLRRALEKNEDLERRWTVFERENRYDDAVESGYQNAEDTANQDKVFAPSSSDYYDIAFRSYEEVKTERERYRKPEPERDPNVILGKEGKPFESRERAERIGKIAAKGRPFTVEERDGGFAAVIQPQEEAPAAAPAPAPTPEPTPTTAPTETNPRLEYLREALGVENLRVVPTKEKLRSVHGLDAKVIGAAENLAEFFGKKLVFLEGIPSNGVVIPGDPNVYLNPDSTRNEFTVVAHELFHQLEIDAPDLYQKVVSVLHADLEPYAKERGHQGMEKERLQSELLADYFAEKAGDVDFWDKLAESDPGAFERFVNYVRRIMAAVRAHILKTNVEVGHFLINAAQVEDAMVYAMREYKHRQGSADLMNDPGPLYMDRITQGRKEALINLEDSIQKTGSITRDDFIRHISPEKTQRTTRIHLRLDNTGETKEWKGKNVLVYGSGFGDAARFYEADSYEPFPGPSQRPTYFGDRVAGTGDDINLGSYDKILNTFVLNVVDPETRAWIIRDIANILKTGGEAVIVTRGTDVTRQVSQNKKKGTLLLDFPSESEGIFLSGRTLTYQKGFSRQELADYVSSVLGRGFDVLPLGSTFTGATPGIRIIKRTSQRIPNPPIVSQATKKEIQGVPPRYMDFNQEFTNPKSETLDAAAIQFTKGEITYEDYIEVARQEGMLRELQQVPVLTGDKKTGDLPKQGDQVVLRLDREHWANQKATRLYTDRGFGTPTGRLTAVTFPVAPGVQVESSVIAVSRETRGYWQSEVSQKQAEAAFDSGEWTQLDANNNRFTYFYDRATGMLVVGADEVIHFGGMTLAKGVKYADPPVGGVVENFSSTSKANSNTLPGTQPGILSADGIYSPTQLFGEEVATPHQVEQFKEIVKPRVKKDYFDSDRVVDMEGVEEAVSLYSNLISGKVNPRQEMVTRYAQDPESTTYDMAQQALVGELMTYAFKAADVLGDNTLLDYMRKLLDPEATIAGKQLNARSQYVQMWNEADRQAKKDRDRRLRLIAGGTDKKLTDFKNKDPGKDFPALLKELENLLASADPGTFSDAEIADFIKRMEELGGKRLFSPNEQEEADFAKAREAEAKEIDLANERIKKAIQKFFPKDDQGARRLRDLFQQFIAGQITEETFGTELGKLELPSREQKELIKTGKRTQGARDTTKDARKKLKERERKPEAQGHANIMIREIEKRLGLRDQGKNRKGPNEVRKIYRRFLLSETALSKAEFRVELEALQVSTQQIDTLWDLLQKDRADRAKSQLSRDGNRAFDRSVGDIMQELLKHPLMKLVGRQQQEALATRILVQKAKIPEAQARILAKEFQAKFQSKFEEARVRLARRFLKGNPVWAKKLNRIKIKPKKSFLERVRRDIRSGAADPDLRSLVEILEDATRLSAINPQGPTVTEQLAEQNGWVGFTRAEIIQLHEIDAQLDDDSLTLTERTALQSDMGKIIAHATVGIDIRRALVSAMLANIFSGVKTWMLQLSVLNNIGIRTFLTGPIAGLVGDMKQDANLSFGGWMLATRNMGHSIAAGVRAGIFTGKTGINKVDVEAEVKYAVSELDLIWERAEKIRKDPKATSLQKAGMIRDYYLGVGRFTFRILKLLDASVQEIIVDQQSIIAGATRGMRAGLTFEEVGELFKQQVDLVGEFQREGRDRGYSQAMSNTYAMDRLRMTWYNAMEGKASARTGSTVDIATGIRDLGLREAKLETGVKEIENGITGLGIPIRAIQEWMRGLGPIGRSFIPVIQTPWNVFHRSAWFSVWGIPRLIKTAYRTRENQMGDNSFADFVGWTFRGMPGAFGDMSHPSNPYPASMGTPSQAILRVVESAIGTVFSAAVFSLWAMNRGREDEDKFFRINLRGPSYANPTERTAWESTGRRSYTIQFRIGGNWTSAGFRRGGFEVLNFPLTLLGIADQAEYSTGKEQDKLISWSSVLFAEMIGEALFFARGVTSRGSIWDAQSVGKEAGFRASAFIPFSSFLKTANRFTDYPETDRFATAFLAQMPIIPLVADQSPRRNGLGDVVGGASKQGFDFAQKLGVPIGYVPVDPERWPHYTMLNKHDYFPSPPPRSRYGDISDKTYSDFLIRRGEIVKQQMENSWDFLLSVDSKKFRNRMSSITRLATIKAQRELGLRPIE